LLEISTESRRTQGRKHRDGQSAPAAVGVSPHAQAMFVVTEADTVAVRTAFDEGGELSAAVELRRRFPGITDNARARTCARAIVGWQPVVVSSPKSVIRLRRRADW
jgi:hypothetical protein